jgi:hypothetical protein
MWAGAPVGGLDHLSGHVPPAQAGGLDLYEPANKGWFSDPMGTLTLCPCRGLATPVEFEAPRGESDTPLDNCCSPRGVAAGDGSRIPSVRRGLHPMFRFFIIRRTAIPLSPEGDGPLAGNLWIAGRATTG